MAKTKGLPALSNTNELMVNRAEAKTGPIYHNPDFGSFNPGQRSGVNMDEPFYHTGKSLREVMAEAGHGGDYHDVTPTYGGQTTGIDIGSMATRADIPKLKRSSAPTGPMPAHGSPRATGGRNTSGHGGSNNPMVTGLAMGMGMHGASRKGHLIEAIELAGLHEHAGNNQKIIDNLVNK